MSRGEGQRERLRAPAIPDKDEKKQRKRGERASERARDRLTGREKETDGSTKGTKPRSWVSSV